MRQLITSDDNSSDDRPQTLDDLASPPTLPISLKTEGFDRFMLFGSTEHLGKPKINRLFSRMEAELASALLNPTAAGKTARRNTRRRS
ncbi:hypothetical protein [uncultured Rhodoblastus sp.]|uniref:hypothetical protein n=1 Tax=uncultured Rhodoblastus sp. TaxID=543037 RepID=UPI0025EC86F4|nr:hypothetical protein [uncultured Rhodoblastus sp.]